jgi:hypothetical protein
MKRSPLKRKPFKKKKAGNESEIKKLHKKAWSLMSIYIRLRDRKCVTCGRVINLQAGHFIHGKLDFDERNINAQCRRCNFFKSGNLADYAVYLEEKFGFGIIQDLQGDATMIVKHTVEELSYTILALTEKIEVLKNQRRREINGKAKG